MRALLDVNVLIALLDAEHLHHRTATDWLAANLGSGWASCALTQNGCMRILSLPQYPNSQPPAEVARRLATAVAQKSHVFWPDSLSLLDDGRLRWDRVLASRQITDVYLLALAVACKGRLVTFNRGIAFGAVAGATARHLLTLG